jgi:hypothetical protein
MRQLKSNLQSLINHEHEQFREKSRPHADHKKLE